MSVKGTWKKRCRFHFVFIVDDAHIRVNCASPYSILRGHAITFRIAAIFHLLTIQRDLYASATRPLCFGISCGVRDTRLWLVYPVFRLHISILGTLV